MNKITEADWRKMAGRDPAIMTADQAREFRAGHDARARELTRKTKSMLFIARSERLRAEGVISYGGPSSKDELVRDLLERDYPIAKLNEASHVLYHEGMVWTACNWCHPHHDDRCECDLRYASPPPSAPGVSAPGMANPPTTSPTTPAPAGTTTPSSAADPKPAEYEGVSWMAAIGGGA